MRKHIESLYMTMRCSYRSTYHRHMLTNV